MPFNSRTCEGLTLMPIAELQAVMAEIRKQWDSIRDVPFPLYDAECEQIARGAIAALDRHRAALANAR